VGDAFALEDLHGGLDGSHPGHGGLLVQAAVSCGPTAARRA
jgi:hypothetical protein